MSSHKNLTIVTPPEDFGQFKNYGRSIFDSNNEGSTTTTATEGSTDSGILGKLMVPMSTPAPLNCAMPPTEAATPLGGNSLGSPRRNRVMSIYRTDVSPTKQHKAVVPIDYTPPVNTPRGGSKGKMLPIVGVKTNTPNTVVLRILLPSQYCANFCAHPKEVEKIRARTGAHIDVATELNSNDEYLVSITGCYPHCVRALRSMFHMFPDAEGMYAKFPVALAQVGAVIGKNGASVTQIRTGCSVSVRVLAEEEGEPYMPERVLYVLGGSENCVTAVLMAFDTLLDLPNSKIFRGNIPQAQLDNDQIVCALGPVDHRAKESVRKKSKEMHNEKVQSPTKRQRTSETPYELPGSAAVSVNVNQSQASVLIGHKGSTIHLIRELSSARVSIENCEGEKDRRELLVMGTVKQCEHALNLLQQCFLPKNIGRAKGDPPELDINGKSSRDAVTSAPSTIRHAQVVAQPAPPPTMLQHQPVPPPPLQHQPAPPPPPPLVSSASASSSQVPPPLLASAVHAGPSFLTAPQTPPGAPSVPRAEWDSPAGLVDVKFQSCPWNQ